MSPGGHWANADPPRRGPHGQFVAETPPEAAVVIKEIRRLQIKAEQATWRRERWRCLFGLAIAVWLLWPTRAHTVTVTWRVIEATTAGVLIGMAVSMALNHFERLRRLRRVQP